MVAIPADPARPTYDLQAPTPERLSAPATSAPRDDAPQVLLTLVLTTTGRETGPLSKREEIDLSHRIAPRANATVTARMTTAMAKNTATRERRRLTPPPPR